MGGLEILQRGVGAVALPARTVVRVRGDKPLDFLHAVATQERATLAPGRGALACYLDANGHVLAEFRVLPLDGDELLLDGEAAARDALLGPLARIAPLSGCEISDESDAWETVALRGPQADAALGRALPPDEHSVVGKDGTLMVRVSWGVPGCDVIAPVGRLPSLDAEPVDAAAFEAARIAAGRPAFGVDVTPELLVNETPLIERAVSFTKGCYPGQESVARIRNLGRIRRRLVGLDLDGPAPERGAPVRRDGEDAGRVTSAAPARSAAIALLRAEVADGERVSAGEATGTVRPLFDAR